MTFTRPLLFSLPVVAAVTAAFFICAEGKAEPSLQEHDMPTLSGQQSVGDSVSGNYLAARFAQRRQDWSAAEKFMSNVLAQDQGNNVLLQRTFLLALGSGDADKARQHATNIIKDNGKAELALIFLTSDDFKQGRYQDALKRLDQLSGDGFGQYTKPLLTAWALVGAGKPDEAIKLLKPIKADEDEDPAFSLHIGMIYDYMKKPDKALSYYKRAVQDHISLHSALTLGAFLSQHGEDKMAGMIYDSIAKAYPHSSVPNAKNGQSLAAITKPADGAAITLLDLATLLYEKNSYDSALIYARLVEHIDPQSPFVKVMLGDIMAFYDRADDAVKYYQSVTRDSPLYPVAHLREIDVLEESGRLDEALAILDDMSKNEDTRTEAFVYMGDLYRRHQKYDKAVTSYTAALDSIGTLTEKHWPLVYARGMAFERTNNWALAEKDLLQALEFQPNNPLVLNYLGYSWADQGKNLDKALEMIKKAVMLRPDDGYILDSYGWALFHSGKLEEGVTWLERAVERAPEDSVINDHLGDAYWKSDRKLEAKFQWKRAADLADDPITKARIDRKVASGMIDDGAPRKAEAQWPQ